MTSSARGTPPSPRSIELLRGWELLAAVWLTLGSLMSIGLLYALWEGITGLGLHAMPFGSNPGSIVVAAILATGVVSGIGGMLVQVHLEKLRSRLGLRGPGRTLRMALCLLVGWFSALLSVAYGIH